MRRLTVIAASFALAGAARAQSAPAESWAQAARFQGLIEESRTRPTAGAAQLAQTALPPCAPPLAAAPDPGKERPCAISPRRSEGGVYGLLKPQKLVLAAESRDKGPVNTGFKALGRAGQTGKVDGPGRQGNGTYQVGKNDPYEVNLWIATGYVQGWVILKRDPQTGRDKLRFAVKYWDRGKGAWGPGVDAANEVQITYDAGRDEGRIRWQENGKWKEEGYWGGKEGKRSMTIELAGGWDHDFEQD